MSDELALTKANGGQLEKIGDALPVQQDAENTLLGIIGAAVNSPEVDAEKVERLLKVYQTVTEDKRRTAFYEALARLQADLPQIRRSGKIVDNKGGLRKYAKLEDLHNAIQPLLQREGFAFSFNEKAVNPNGTLFEISGTLSHKDGHAETKVITVPFDKSPYRTDIQSRGSSQSYAHRYLIKMHLNIVEHNEDDDGSGISVTPITKAQIAELKSQLAEAKIRDQAFLKYMKVDGFEQIKLADWQKAQNLIRTKKDSHASD